MIQLAMTCNSRKPSIAKLFSFTTLLIIGCWLPINARGDQQRTGTSPNILLICIDDLRPELACYGKQYISSPNIDALAASGCLFEKHFVQAPTCGASRYALLTGCYGDTNNDALFKRAEQLKRSQQQLKKQAKQPPQSLPGWFRTHGYQTVAVGKVSHHPGGLGGSDWNDPSLEEMPQEWTRQPMPCGPWLHPRGVMHGLARGEIREQATNMAVMQSEPGDDQIYPDGLITQAALDEMQTLANDSKPFLLAVGLIRPHLPFGAPAKYMDPYVDVPLPEIANLDKPQGRSTWHGSGEFMKYNRWGRDPRNDAAFADAIRKHYAACVSYADAQVGLLLKQLKTLELDDNTIVVLWGDHGWHLGERNIWGKHSLFDEALHSPLIVRAPNASVPGSRCSAIVQSIDVLPTLCELTGLNAPKSTHGNSLVAKLQAPETTGGTAVSYWGGKNKIYSLRTTDHRLVLHPDQFCELYDYSNNQVGPANVAGDNPALTESLKSELLSKLEAVDIRDSP